MDGIDCMTWGWRVRTDCTNPWLFLIMFYFYESLDEFSIPGRYVPVRVRSYQIFLPSLMELPFTTCLISITFFNDIFYLFKGRASCCSIDFWWTTCSESREKHSPMGHLLLQLGYLYIKLKKLQIIHILY